jgi:endonuclease YncB( thermonuclease family)
MFLKLLLGYNSDAIARRVAMTRVMLMATVLASMALACAAPANSQEISGPAQAADGDSLVLTGTRVRLFGIDAPELAQSCDRDGSAWSCGEAAKAELDKLVQGASVTCKGRETDAYGRLVATCRVGKLDLAEAMVAAGWATAFTQFSTDYVEAETRAKRFKLGIWASTFETPAAWRDAHPREAPQVVRSTAADRPTPPRPVVYRDGAGRCAIKGNHSRRGEWIYYLPGQPYYEQTRPEALFCTEEAAQRAGYRASRAG